MNLVDLTFFFEKDTFLFFGMLLLIALTGLFSERAGIINIALEGQLVIGAFGYTLIGYLTQDCFANNLSEFNVLIVRLLLSVLGSFVLVFVLTAIFAFLTVTMRLNQILSGVALNILITAMAGFFILLISDEESFNAGTHYISLSQNFSNTYISIPYKGAQDGSSFMIKFFSPLIILLVSLPFIHFFLYRTTPGLRIRSCGEKPRVTRSAGINVNKYRYGALFIGVFFMVGASIMFIEIQTLFNGGAQGYGYLGLAMLILGNRNILLMTFFTLIFSIFYRLSITLNDFIFSEENFGDKKTGWQDFGREFFRSINYILSLLCLLFYKFIQRRGTLTAAPESLGK